MANEYQKRRKRKQTFADGSSLTELPDGGMIISDGNKTPQALNSDPVPYRTTDPSKSEKKNPL